MISAYAIRVEHSISEYGLCEGPCPCVEWAVSGGAQSAYHIVINYNDSTLWDSGWVSCRESRAQYDGPQLPIGESCDGFVTLRDEQNAEGDAAFFPITFASLPQWSAQWLADPEPKEDCPSLFIGEFFARKTVSHACIFTAATGYAEISLNDDLIEDCRMDPAFSEYEKRCYYTFTPFLQPKKGKNVIQALLSPGWRSKYNVCYKHMKDMLPPYTGEPVFSASVHVVYTDGSDEWFHTNDNWKCSKTNTVYSNIFMGETYDAAFQPEPAVRAKVVDCPTEKMTLQTLPAVREQEEYEPVAIWEIEPDCFVVDFGQNIAGVCELELPEMEKGQTITIEHMEHLDEDGSLYMANLRNAACKDTYIAAGNETDKTFWMPRYTYHGFRYAQVRGYGCQLLRENITAISLYTDVASGSSFRCGSAHVNTVQKMVVQTEKANIHSILTDCPQRDERMGWMNDATVRFEETPYNFDISRLFPKVVRDLMDVQDDQGRITCTAPFAFGGRPADPVCSSFLVAGWQSYLHTGNTDILAEAFDSFRAWDDYLESRSEDGVVQYSYYGDWASPAYACDHPNGANSAVTPGILMSTGYHYYNNVLLSKMAQIIGRDAAPFLARAKKVREGFLKKWWNAETGLVATGSQGCQAFALWLDILPEEGREKAALALHEDLAAKNYQFTTGNLCTRYMMDQLTRWGYTEDAWKLITKESYPSFGYMMENEATTVWERFELKKDPGMNSHNHPMYGAVGYWLYACLAGMKSAGAGWKKAEIEPHYPKELLSCQATVDTPLGDLSVRWIKRYGTLHLYVQIPQGMEAHVVTPEGPVIVGGGFHHWAKEISD